jgi:hypothetical protein
VIDPAIVLALFWLIGGTVAVIFIGAVAVCVYSVLDDQRREREQEAAYLAEMATPWPEGPRSMPRRGRQRKVSKI